MACLDSPTEIILLETALSFPNINSLSTVKINMCDWLQLKVIQKRSGFVARKGLVLWPEQLLNT